MNVIIDAYNIAGWFGYFEFLKEGKITLREVRKKVFKDILENPLLSLRDRRIKVDLIFDSGGEKRLKKLERREIQGIKIIFSRRKETADDFIWRNAEKGDAVVVTEDNELRKRLEEKGVQVCDPEFFFGDKNQKN